MSIPFGIAIIVFLVLGNGFFVALEFALVASDKEKLKIEANEGSRTAQSAVKCLKRLSFHLSGAQLGITLTSLSLGFMVEPIVGQLLADTFGSVFASSSTTATILVALFIATIFQMVAGELIPKSIAISEPEKISKMLSPIAVVVNGLFSPLIIVFNGAANKIVRAIGLEPQEELEETHSLEDLKYIIKSSATSGTLKNDTTELLNKTIRFGDKTAADALTQRVDVKYLKGDDTIDKLISTAGENGYSKYPVTTSDLDNVIGVVDLSYAFSIEQKLRNTIPITQIMTEPLVVPETRELVDCLEDFARAKIPFAIVVDEHGGTEGVITREDVIEEIVGEIDDEHDGQDYMGSNLTHGLAQDSSLVQGATTTDEIHEMFAIELPEGPYETIAGYIMANLGRVPINGDRVTNDEFTFEVVKMDRNRVATVMVEAAPKNDELEEGS